MGLLADLAAVVTDPFMAQRVVANGVETRGMLDDQEAVMVTAGGALEAGEGVLVRERVLTLVASTVPTLARKQTIQIGAVEDDDTLTDYVVRDIRRQTDGLLIEVVVVAAP